MTRSQVYDIIDGERAYQQITHSIKEDSETPVANFIVYMEKCLNDAKAELYTNGDEAALGCIRKVTALGVAVMESMPEESVPRRAL